MREPHKNRFGPSRRELRFRVFVSGGGLLMLLYTAILQGWPPGFAMLEVLGIGGAFFGATLLISLRKLQRRDQEEDEDNAQ